MTRPKLHLYLALPLLLVFFAQTMQASRRLSLTYDEPIYTALGYADWVTRDPRWHQVIGHPPLVNLLTSWPLLLGPTHPDPTQVPGWGTEDALGFSRALVVQLGSLDRVALVTRLPVMGLALLLAAFVYRWAQQTWGGAAGLLALGLYVFDPALLAHGQLNTTDMGVTAFGVMGCYALARYLRRPSRWAFLGAGLALGAALASKASGPFWLGAAGLVMALYWRPEFRPGRRLALLRRWLVRLAGLVGIALFVLWAAYLFETRPLTPGGLPIPAASHWAGLPYIRAYLATGQTTFLAGRLIPGGHWGYFPLALLLKTPLPTLIGLLLALGVTVRHGLGPRWSAVPLAAVPLTYLALAMLTALNIGHRHLLPLMPFLFIFIARLAAPHAAGDRQRTLRFTPHLSRLIGAGLLAWYLIGTLRVAPHYLAYFNELAGGPDGGYRYLADSSLDWGQALKALKRYQDEQGGETMRLAAFSSLDPALYGLRFEPIPPTVGAPITLTARFNPAPGLYAISVTPLQGVWVLDPDTYDWFRHREPVARVGHVLFVYRVEPPAPAPTWVAQCAAPTPPLSAEQVAEGFGIAGLRLLAFDCRQSWLYPTGGPGWYVLPKGPTDEGWVRERLARARLSFAQREHWSHRALAIYAWAGEGKALASLRRDASLPGDGTPTGQESPVEAPIRLDGPLTFLGYWVAGETAAPGQTVELTTVWRVEERPARPLSLMAHLVRADGVPIVVGDGMGVPVEQWQPGDILVQRHRLPIPPGTPPGRYRLQTGAYWLDTMARFPVLVEGQPTGDRLLLATMEVR